MSKFILSCCITVLIFVAPLSVLFQTEQGALSDERRQMAAFPDFPDKVRSRTLKQYFRGIDTFFADHFPLRAQFLDISMLVHEVAGDTPDIEKCYRGLDNWLFLGNSYGRCVDQLQGRARISGNNLKLQVAYFEQRQAEAKKRGAAFAVFVCPNKASIYPEYLPAIVTPAPTPFITPFVEALRTAGINVYDPTSLLISKKGDGLLYFRSDTHWNFRGAYEALNGLNAHLKLPPLPPVSWKDAPVHKGDLVGMLGYDKFPLATGDNVEPVWQTPLTAKIEPEHSSNPQAPSDKVVWVFGDSFTGALWPFLASEFKEVYFFKHEKYAEVMATRTDKPDLVLWAIVERNLALAD